MRTLLKNIGFVSILLVIFLMTSKSLYAQPPTWNLDVAAFEHSTTFTWQVTFTSSRSVEAGDFMAAFVGDEVRGVVHALNNPNLNQYFFLFLVYSNEPTGENISFKFYDTSEDKIEDVDQEFAFEPNQLTGNFSNPLTFIVDDILEQTITFDPLAAVIYGDADFSLAATGGASGNEVTFVSSDPTVATVSGNIVTIVGAGSTEITAAQLGNGFYADAIDVIQSLVVNSKAVTVTANTLSKTYGDDDPELTYLVTSGTLESGDAFIGSLSRELGEDAGAFNINQGTISAGSNYTLTYVSNDLTITKRALEITAGDKTKTTGETDPELTYVVTSGTLVFSDVLAGDLMREAGESAGTYAINPGSLSASGNYNLSFVPGTFTITAQISQTITFDPLAPVTYGDANFILTATGGASGNEVTFVSSDPAVATVSGNNLIIVGAGSTNITASQLGNVTHADASDVIQPLTIIPISVEISADDASKTYGESDPVFTYQITSGELEIADFFTGTLMRLAGESAGTHAIQFGTVTAGSNYNLSFVSADLTINQKTLTVSANDKTITYGDDQNSAHTVSYDGFIIGENISDLSGSLLFANITGVNSGTYSGTIIPSGLTSSNYDISYLNGDLDISKRVIEVTADAKSKTYGDSDPSLSYQITAGSLAFSDVFTGNLSREVGENIGSYSIEQNNLALNSNYTLSYISTDLTITKRAIEITADAKNKTYGDNDPSLSYQITTGSLAIGDAFSGTLSRVAGEDVGTYTIEQNNLGLNGNYTLSYISNDLTISERAIEITAAAKSKTYGDIDPSLSYQITTGSLAIGDAFSGDLSRVTGEDVGTYSIEQNNLGLNGNYTLSYISNDLTITERAIEITADAKSKTYGDIDPSLSYQITTGSLVFSDTFTGTLSRVAGEDVGSYTIEQNNIALNSNYTLSYISNDLTITQRAIEITADAKSKTYGDNDPLLSYQITTGSLAFSDAFTGDLSRETGENVGTYGMGQNNITLNSNYTLSYISNDLTITKRAIEVTADAKSKTYGDNDPSLSYQVTTGSLAFSDAFTGTLSRVAGEGVGSYTIEQNDLGLNGNYTVSYISNGLTITKRVIEITANAKSKTYGDNDPSLPYQITTGSLAIGDAFTGALSRVAGEDVGTYTIEQNNIALNSNYTLSYISNDLTITKRAIEITADAKSKIYGDSDPSLSHRITTGSLAFSDAVTGTLSRVAGEDVGTYTIEQNNLGINGNYTLSYISNDLTITERTIEITADAKTKTYGDNDPSLSYQITTGSLAFGDVVTGTLSRIAGENVGTYTIEQNNITLNGNYILNYVPNDLTITKRAIEITADAKTKTYGDSDPSLSYQVTTGSLAFSDTFTGTLSRVAGEDVGTYMIEQNNLALNGNYILVYVSNNLTITKRDIEITADAKSKTYGDNDPSLSYQITTGSLAIGDTFTGILSRLAGEDVGTYMIAQNNLGLNGNYTLSYISNDLTITKKALEITAGDKTKTTGETDPELTYVVTSGTLVFSDVLAGDLIREAGEPVGTYAINQGALTAGGNYNLSFVPGTFNITDQVSQTITFDPLAVVTYGGANFILTATGGASGNEVTFVSSDPAVATVSGNSVTVVGAGSTNITASQLGNVTHANASDVIQPLTIIPKSIVISADDASKAYGDSDPALTYQITSGELEVADSFTGSVMRLAGESAGTHAIQQGSVTAGSNYDISFVSADLTINALSIEITADPMSKTYGVADPALLYQVTTGSLVFSDVFTGILNRETGQNAGLYAIQLGTVTAGSNYNLSFVSADLTINQKTLTISANDKTITYGDDQNSEHTVSYDGFIIGENTSFLNGSLLFANITDVNSGTYSGAIIPSGLTSSNYDISYLNGDLDISKRVIEITADAKSKIYGDNDPSLSYQITTGSLAFSDAFTGTLSRVAGEDVGSYTIEQNNLALNSNYTLLYISNDLDISKRVIEITADAKSKTYGDNDPSLSYQITTGSLAFSDAFTGNLSREVGENIGSYSIEQNNLALNSNYTLLYTSNDLTITKRVIAITADAKGKTYGDSDPSLSYQITTGSLAIGDAFTGTLSRVAGEDVGTYTIEQNNLGLNGNYTLSYISNNLTITKRAIEITAAAKSKTYGDSDPSLSYQITTGSLAIGDAFSGDLSRVAGEDVGTYSIEQNNLGLNGNYTLSYISNELTITKRAIEITADVKSKTYGDIDPSLSHQITAGSLAIGDAFTGILSRVAGEDVGAYIIEQNNVALNSNYALSYISNDLTISERAIEITADAKSKTYGDNDPSLSYQMTTGSLAFSDAFTGTLSREVGENIGSYSIEQNNLALNSNYTLLYISNDLTITKRLIEITADSKSKTYGDNDPLLSYQITTGSLAIGDAFTGSLSRVAGEDVGSYSIGQNNLGLNGNYTVSYISNGLTITKRVIEITANAKSKTYGDNDPLLSYQITTGSLAIGDAFTGILFRLVGEDVGAYTINQGTVGAGTNYILTYVADNLTIKTRAIEITADATNKTYGNPDPALTYQITKGSLAFSDDVTGSLTRAAGEYVGAHVINQGTVDSGTNYSVTYVSDNLTIGTRTIEITADGTNKTYGDADPELTYQITEGSLVFSDVLTGSLTRVDGENIGTYALNQGTVDADNNYVVTYVSDNLTIGTRAIEITADATNKTYGDLDPSLSYQITEGSFAFSDVITGSLTRVDGENIGTYAVILGTVDAGANYHLTYISSDLTIGKRSIEITALDITKTIDDADPGLTYIITSGVLQFSDLLTGSLSRVSGEIAGTYAINQGLLVSNENYILSFVPGTFTITSLFTQTITFDPLSAKIFGDTEITLVSTGGESGNSITYSSSNTAVAMVTENKVTIVGAGITNITASQAGDETYAPASDVIQPLTIYQATQMIIFDALSDKSITDGDFSLTAIGGASGNTVTFSSSNTAIATVSGNTVNIIGVGTTNITASQEGNTNYSAAIDVVQSLIVHDLMAQVIIFNALANVTYGHPNFAMTATGGDSGNVVTFSSSDPSVATVLGNTVTVVGAGSTEITASQLGDDSYADAVDVMRNLIITPRELIITADDKIQAIGEDVPILTMSYSGFVNGEDQNVIDIAPSISTQAIPSSEPGNYPIVLNGGSDTNYEFILVDGTLTVESITSVEYEILQEVSIYPVPFVNSFTISLPENNLGIYTLTIRNVDGKKLLKKELKPQLFNHEVHALSTATTGIYFVQLELNGAVRNYMISKK